MRDKGELLEDTISKGITLHFGVKSSFFVHAAVADTWAVTYLTTYTTGCQHHLAVHANDVQ